MNKDSRNIALFPLDVFLLPTEQLPLHIFEPQFKELFDDVEQNDLRFALPYSIPNSDRTLASACKLIKVIKRSDSGERDVIIECESVHPLTNQARFFPGKTYPSGTILESINCPWNKVAPIDILELFADIIELKFKKRPLLSEIEHYQLLEVSACIGLKNTDKLKIILSEDAFHCENHLRSALKYLHFICLQESKTESGIFLN